MGFLNVVKSVPGLTHYYPLNDKWEARDAVGTAHGTNRGATFGANGATFNGSSYIDLPDHVDFSVLTKRALTIFVCQTISSWQGVGGNREYIHWMGKGRPGAHEWTFRHYVYPSTVGEAGTRPKRTSFYHFNPDGGLGAGSFFQDDDAPGVERVIAGTCDMTSISMWKNGAKRDTDPLSGYKIVPANTASPVTLGTLGDGTGFMVGRLRRLAFFNRVLTEAELKTLYAARLQDEEDAPAPAPAAPIATPPSLEIPAGSDLYTTQVKHNELIKALKAKGSL